MKNSLYVSWMLILGLIFVVRPVLGQNKTASSAAPAPTPRAADRKPDLTGVYQVSTKRGAWEIAPGYGRVLPGVTARAQDIMNEPPPYQPWAAKKQMELANEHSIDPDASCLPSGIPRVYFSRSFPMQIVQTPKAVIMLYEYQSVFRYIPLNAKHRDDIGPTFMGDPVGHWEGDTLVVDITNFNDKTWLGSGGFGTPLGAFHTEALHVVERFTRVDKDQLNYEATLEDPNVFTKPWHVHQTLMFRQDTLLTEYICSENNLDPQRIRKIQEENAGK